MSVPKGFVSFLRELGLLDPTSDADSPAEGASRETAFDPEDLENMQAIFDQACRLRHPLQEPDRAAIATAVFNAYREGVHDRDRLLAAAMAVRAQ
jgi:hypothetical protein